MCRASTELDSPHRLHRYRLEDVLRTANADAEASATERKIREKSKTVRTANMPPGSIKRGRIIHLIQGGPRPIASTCYFIASSKPNRLSSPSTSTRLAGYFRACSICYTRSPNEHVRFSRRGSLCRSRESSHNIIGNNRAMKIIGVNSRIRGQFNP